MSSIGTAAARILALALGVLFIVLASALILATSTERTLLSAGTYDHVFSDGPWLDQAIRGVITDYFERNPLGSAAGQVLGRLSPNDWDFLVSEVALPDQVRGAARSVAGNLVEWLQSDAPGLELRIPLGDIKHRLAGDPGKRIVERVLFALPDCAAERAMEWLAQPTAETLPLCLPPVPLRPLALNTAQSILATAANRLPESVDLLEVTNRSDALAPGLVNLRSSVRWVIQLTRVSVLAPLALLLLVTLFAVRSLRGLFGWWGALVLLSGLGVLFASTLVAAALPAMIQRAVPGSVAMPAWAAAAVTEIAGSVARQVAAQARGISLIAAGSGAVLLFISALLPRRRGSTTTER